MLHIFITSQAMYTVYVVIFTWGKKELGHYVKGL